MVAPEVIQATVTNYMAANNALDVERFVAMFAPDATFYNVTPEPVSGPEAVRQIAEQSLIPFQEMNATINQTFISDDGAAVYYTVQMTAKNGRQVVSDGIDVFEVNNEGKIQTLRLFFDLTKLATLFD